MSLFKIFKGQKSELNQLKKTQEGYAYYTSDDSHMYVDLATGTLAENSEEKDSQGTVLRRKVIGLSQVNKPFTLNFVENTLKVSDAYFKANGYTYIVSPSEDSYDAYAEAGIRASLIEEGSMTFTCKELPATAINVSILRIEEDPYEQV